MPCEIVAELSCNHLGSIERALTLIDAAADAGADAVKFQCWTQGTMAKDGDQVIASGPWAGKTLDALYAECWTPWTWFGPLINRANARRIPWFSSVFDLGALRFLEQLDCPRYKISSFELTDLKLIEAVGITYKPMIVSTGMSTYNEVRAARLAAGIGRDITWLHCVSAYPALLSDMNLSTLDVYAERGWDFGLSDHSLGWEAAMCAAAMGAYMIEKHLTLLRADGGPDAAFSLEPQEFRSMVEHVRLAQLLRGTPRDGALKSESYVGLRRTSGAGRG